VKQKIRNIPVNETKMRRAVRYRRKLNAYIRLLPYVNVYQRLEVLFIEIYWTK